MIRNFKELQKYRIKDAERYTDPIHINRCMLVQNTLDENRLEILRQTLKDIPESYLKWLKYLNMKVCLGYFQLNPSVMDNNDIVDAVIEANTKNIFADLTEQYGMYYIGRNNDLSIFVATGKKEFEEGEIIILDEGYIPDPDTFVAIRPLAKDFEQFMILAGNLNQIHREINNDSSNFDAKVGEFVQRLKILGVDEKYHAGWMTAF